MLPYMIFLVDDCTDISLIQATYLVGSRGEARKKNLGWANCKKKKILDKANCLI